MGIISEISPGFEMNTNSFNLQNAWTVIDSAINEKITPGAQVFISKEGKVVSSRGFGFQTYDNNSPPIDEASIYDVASLTKVLATTPVSMKLIAQNKTAKEIGVILFTSSRTVEKHKSHIINKLNIESHQNSLLIWAKENQDFFL